MSYCVGHKDDDKEYGWEMPRNPFPPSYMPFPSAAESAEAMFAAQGRKPSDSGWALCARGRLRASALVLEVLDPPSAEPLLLVSVVRNVKQAVT